MIDEIVPPFYVTLKGHDFLLYNCMLDSGASNNLMPKVIMDQIQLQLLVLIMTFTPLIQRKYHA